MDILVILYQCKSQVHFAERRIMKTGFRQADTDVIQYPPGDYSNAETITVPIAASSSLKSTPT